MLLFKVDNIVSVIWRAVSNNPYEKRFETGRKDYFIDMGDKLLIDDNFIILVLIRVYGRAGDNL